MATLNYRDPTTGDWVAMPVYEGPAGPAGPAGPTGPVAVSAATGNSATLGTDGQVFVSATGGLAPTVAAALYVDVPGDAMTGELLVPDQTVTNPTDPLTAAARGYVDQVVTVSEVEPTGVTPKRDGQAWFVVATQQPTTTTLAADVASVSVGGVVTLTADTTADVGTIQFKKDGANLGAPVAVSAAGVAVTTDAPSVVGTVTYGAVYVATEAWAGSAASDVTVTVTQPAAITLTYADAAAAGFTISGAYTVDWGDGSAVESFAAGVAAAHTYAGAHGPVSVDPQAGNTLTSFATAADSPLTIAFGVGTLTHVDFTLTKALQQVDFLVPVVLDSCRNLFENQATLTSVTGSISSVGTDFARMFSGCTLLTTTPHVEARNGTIFNMMFDSCFSLVNPPQVDTLLGVDFSFMFAGCIALTTAPNLVTPLGVAFMSMFQECFSLTTVPPLETGRARSTHSMFQLCTSLTTIPSLDTFWVRETSEMFKGCSSLITVPETGGAPLNFTGSFFNLNTFTGCSALTWIDVIGVFQSISVANTSMDAAALNHLFDGLITPGIDATVDITGTPGAATCDRTLIPAGWIVVG